MAADDYDIEMERQLSCAICYELYTDPLLLPCLHSLCKGCVTAITKGGTASSFKCPECQQVVTLNKGISTLKRNFPMSSLVAIYNQESKKRRHSSNVRPSDASSSQARNSSQMSCFSQASRAGNVSCDDREVFTNPPGQTGQNHTTKTVISDSPSGIPAQTLPAASSRFGEPNNRIVPSTNAGTPSSSAPPAVFSMLPGATNDGTIRAGSSTKRTQSESNSREASTTHSEFINDPAIQANSTSLTPVISSCLTELPGICSTCDKKPANRASFHCSECCMSFCDYCRGEIHPETGYTASHYVCRLTNTPTESERVSDSCPLCEPTEASAATIQCVQCDIGFCDTCLRAYHPTTESSPEHKLVVLEQKRQLTLGGCNPLLDVVVAVDGHYTPPLVTPTPAIDVRNPELNGPLADSAVDIGDQHHTNDPPLRPRRTPATSTSDVAISQAECLLPHRCSLCTTWAVAMCLDCTIYYCDRCIVYHGFPEHTVVDVTVPLEAGKQGNRQRHSLQLCLVELMDLKTQLMNELMERLAK